MSNSTQRYTVVGSPVAFLDLNIEYFDRGEITVFFNASEAPVDTNWSWSGTTDKRILFSPSVAVGVSIIVKRTTDTSKVRHSYTLGAAFTAATLDEDLVQVLHIAQEAIESNLSGDFFLDIDMHGFKIKNPAVATDPEDVLTYGQYLTDATGVAANAVLAQGAADDAVRAAAIIAGFQWKGTWHPGAFYSKNNIVNYSGTSYIALVNHPAHAAFATDLGLDRWEVFAQKGMAGAGTGDMIAANDLSEVTPAAARAHLGAAKSGANTDITSLASPELVQATATTQAAGDSSTKVATTAMVQAALNARPVMPAGTVFTFAGTSAPAGSLLIPTFATTVSRITYANLFAAIGTTYGAGNGSTTFGLPTLAADDTIINAFGNVGTTSVGAVIGHVHQEQAMQGSILTAVNRTSSGTGAPAPTIATAVQAGDLGPLNTLSTGGAKNYAAGLRLLHCIQY